MTNVKTFLSQPLFRLIAVCALPLGIAPLIQYLAVAPFGSAFFLSFELVIGLYFLAALLTLVVAPFLLIVPHLRLLATRSLIAAIVVIVAVVVGVRLGGRIRMAAFHNLAERSAPLVQAIRSYESEYGTPPPDLTALVPKFLPTIPGTRMAAYPHYKYHVGERASGYDGNPWVLVVFTPSGGINFDMLMYFTLQNYPKAGYGGGIERISDWAYVHE